MSIGQLNIWKKTKVDVAVENVKSFESATKGKGFYLCYSGGKDSILTKIIMELAGVKYDTHYNITGIDPPEVVYQIRKLKDVQMHQHEEDIFSLIMRKLYPPTRRVRYCCQVLKEHGGEGRFCVTGVRWAESNSRSNRNVVDFNAYGSKSKKAQEERKIFLMSDNDQKRRMLETCMITGKHVLNPIIHFEDEEVWEAIKYYNAEYPSLYDEGFKRIGCIGCPKSTKCNRIKEFNRWPKFKENFIRCFDRLLIKRAEIGKQDTWKSGEEVFEWWLNG